MCAYNIELYKIGLNKTKQDRIGSNMIELNEIEPERTREDLKGSDRIE